MVRVWSYECSYLSLVGGLISWCVGLLSVLWCFEGYDELCVGGCPGACGMLCRWVCVCVCVSLCVHRGV